MKEIDKRIFEALEEKTEFRAITDLTSIFFCVAMGTQILQEITKKI